MQSGELVAHYSGQLREVFAPLIPRGRPVALVGFPENSNCGDHAVWLGEKALLTALGVPLAYTCSAQSYNAQEMAAKLGQGTILIHGGGSLGVKGGAFPLTVLRDFPANPTIFSPQLTAFLNDDAVSRIAAALNGRADVTLFVADAAAQKRLGPKLGKGVVAQAPSPAFLIGPQKRLSEPAYDAVWIARTDSERIGDQTEAAARLSSQAPEKFTLPPFDDGIEINFVMKHRPPTVMLTDWSSMFCEGEMNRTAMKKSDFDTQSQVYVRRAGAILSLGHAVVTDRLHAHIHCLLLGIPHVLLNNKSGENGDFHESWTRTSPLCRFSESAAEGWALLRNALPAIKMLEGAGRAAWSWQDAAANG